MKAAVLYEAQKCPLVIEELDIGEPGPGQVMIKMMASGVCHSDWHVVKGEWTVKGICPCRLSSAMKERASSRPQVPA